LHGGASLREGRECARNEAMVWTLSGVRNAALPRPRIGARHSLTLP